MIPTHSLNITFVVQGPELDFVTRIDNLLSENANSKVDFEGITRCCRKGATCNVCNPPEAHNSSLQVEDSVGFVRLLQVCLLCRRVPPPYIVILSARRGPLPAILDQHAPSNPSHPPALLYVHGRRCLIWRRT